MTYPSDQNAQSSSAPAKRIRLTPGELFGFSGVLGVFAGLIVLMSSRSITLTLIFAAIAFVVSLGFVALLGVGAKPNAPREDDAAL